MISAHVFKEYDPLTGVDEKELADLKEFALANQTDRQGNYRPVLALDKRGRLQARNYVGIIETKRGTVLEILPKVDFVGGEDGHHKVRHIFFKMLRAYRGLRTAQFNQTSISELRRFSMLDAFVRLFLDNLVLLTQRGLARHYSGVEDNLPRLRGRILFPQHVRHNAANRSRFYVGFDEFTADRPVNRLIHSAILKLSLAAHPANQQLLHQLRICFSEVPPSAQLEVDWQRHRIDRSMRHYESVMAWVGLFLFNHGLATFRGRHVNQALLFPMEAVFEDFVVDAFRRHQRDYRVGTHGPQKAFTRIGKRKSFYLKPDIALLDSDEVSFILDAKWKKDADNDSNDPKHGIDQKDLYQLYAYGRKFGCATVALVYPRTPKFRSPLRYEFNDKVRRQPLALFCFPFDVVRPNQSVHDILEQLNGWMAGRCA